MSKEDVLSLFWPSTQNYLKEANAAIEKRRKFWQNLQKENTPIEKVIFEWHRELKGNK